jgi:hypothetical protein
MLGFRRPYENPSNARFTFNGFILPAITDAQAGKTTPELHQFAIAISTKNKSVKTGSSVIVEVALTDVSGFKTMLPAGDGEAPWYTIEVRRKDGTPVPKSQLAQARKRESTKSLPPGTFKVDNYSRIMGELQPGETLKEKVVINDLYDLSQPGEYSILARRGVEKSNVISISVSP